MKKALITGITGQDGSHLAELLLAKGYRVYGITRPAHVRTCVPDSANITSDASPLDGVELYQGDLRDQEAVTHILDQVQPDEIYNLASTSFVPASWQDPVLSAESSAVGVTRRK